MINEHILKLIGSTSIPKPLILSHEYKITVFGQVVYETKKDNQDGSFNVIYKMKTERTEIISDNGDIIKSKDKSTRSQKQRYRMKMFKEENGIPGDDEEWYDKTMAKLNFYMPDILKWLEKQQ